MRKLTFTSFDYEKRIEYLKFVGNNANLAEQIILNDFISANLFLNIIKIQKIKIN